MLNLQAGNNQVHSTYQPVSREIFNAYNKVRPGGPKPLVCYVPFNSLTFSWLGKIYACTYNRNIQVGEYPLNSIQEIWNGEKLKKLQAHLQHNDLTYGCQHCKYFVEKQKFTGLKPQGFDKYDDYQAHPYPRVFEFEISNQCNLECIMCNGNTSSAIRQNRDKLPPLAMPYDEAFVEQIKEFVPGLKEAKFFGGEPFLIPIYFRLWEVMTDLNPAISIFVITNGTVLTNKVKALLDKGNFEIAISIDSIRKERYEYIRKNASFESVMNNLLYFNEYAQKRGKRISLSFTTQKDNWDELPEVIEFCNKHGIVFFNSFLTSPAHLSLVFLPSTKLAAIHQQLSAYTLPTGNEVEKYNRNCFNDYLNYIKHYEQKNQNGISYTEPKDNFGLIEEDGTFLQKGIKLNTLADLTNAIQKHAEAEFLPNKDVILETLNNAFTSLNNANLESAVLNDIAKGTMGGLLRNLQNKTTDEVLREIRINYTHLT